MPMVGRILIINIPIDGEPIDILVMDRSIYDGQLSPGLTTYFEIRSFSKTGRCVGKFDPNGYILDYWLTYITEEGQRFTNYFKVNLDDSIPDQAP